MVYKPDGTLSHRDIRSNHVTDCPTMGMLNWPGSYIDGWATMSKVNDLHGCRTVNQRVHSWNIHQENFQVWIFSWNIRLNFPTFRKQKSIENLESETHQNNDHRLLVTRERSRHQFLVEFTIVCWLYKIIINCWLRNITIIFFVHHFSLPPGKPESQLNHQFQ